jgi:hypothetical protein
MSLRQPGGSRPPCPFLGRYALPFLSAAEPCPSAGQVPAHPANPYNGHAGIARQFLVQFRCEIVQWDAVGRKRGEARDLATAALDRGIDACGTSGFEA